MREMIKMIVVLTAITAVSGAALALVKTGTEKRIEEQILKFQKAPAINAIFSEVTNDPLKERFTVTHEEREITFFPGKFEDGSKAVAFEAKGSGFGGDLGLMVGINLESDEIVKVRVTTHSETPGIGSRAKDNTNFVSQFAGMSLDSTFKVKDAGGDVDAMSGATVTSKGVCMAASRAEEIYRQVKPEIIDKIK